VQSNYVAKNSIIEPTNYYQNWESFSQQPKSTANQEGKLKNQYELENLGGIS
jgi:hypothetical protein